MPRLKSGLVISRPNRTASLTWPEFTAYLLIQLTQRKILLCVIALVLLQSKALMSLIGGEAATVRRGSNSFSLPPEYVIYGYDDHERDGIGTYERPKSSATNFIRNTSSTSKSLDRKFEEFINLTLSSEKRPEIITAKSLRLFENSTALTNVTLTSNGNTTTVTNSFRNQTQQPAGEAGSTQRIMQLIQTAAKDGNLRLHKGVGSALTKSLRLTSPALRKAVAKTLRDVALQAGKPLDRIRILRAAMMLAGGGDGDKSKDHTTVEDHSTTTISTLSEKGREVRGYGGGGGGGGCCGSQMVYSVPLCNQNNNDLAELALLSKNQGSTTSTGSSTDSLLPLLAAIIGALLASMMMSG